MRNLFIGVFVVVLMVSCNQSQTELVFEYNAETMQKQLIEAYPSGDTQTVHIFELNNNQPVLYGYQSYFENGSVKIQGRLNQQGLRIGKWESFYPDGSPWSIGTYDTSGVENGLKKVWYENGQIRYQGVIKDGKQDGTWQFFDEKGKEIR